MARSAGRPIVLVVEDEPLQRIAAADMIEEAGFEVVEAADATEAVAILERRLDIRLVFTDIDMPRGLDGLRLAALIRERWPPIEILVTSGKRMPEAHVLPARCVFLPKPYRSRDVISELRRLAGGDGQLS